MMTRVLQFARQNVVFLVISVILVGGFLLLKQDSSVASAAELDVVLRDGRPTVLELFSNT